MNLPDRDRVVRWANLGLFFCNAVSIVAVVLFFSTRKLVSTDSIEYKDLIVIILTALGVMLAVVTLLIGAMAIYGYSTLRDFAAKQAIEAAQVSAARTTTDLLTQDGTGQPGGALLAELQAGRADPGEVSGSKS